jgi:hypothetical protein
MVVPEGRAHRPSQSGVDPGDEVSALIDKVLVPLTEHRSSGAQVGERLTATRRLSLVAGMALPHLSGENSRRAGDRTHSLPWRDGQSGQRARGPPEPLHPVAVLTGS